VVDPIDGTANYCAGIPLFGTMAAALVRGQVVMAAIHDPLTDTTAVALHGQGAWMLHADGGRTPMRVAEPVPLSEMAGCVSWRYMKRPLRDNVCRNMQHMASVADYRCAAHQYRMLASGTLHCLVFNRLMPWDHAPGWLLHQEAGGYSAQWDGTPYDPSVTTGGLLCTPDEASWTTLRDGLLAD
jgi:fructose-1,6-bisphosphatase/inositol monophosphatase family enzyme